MELNFNFEDKKLNNLLTNIISKLSKERQSKALETIAYKSQAIAVLETPKSKGETRRGWRVDKKGALEFLIINLNKIALFLDEGTGVFGKRKKVIRPIRKKFLYIPLRKSARIWRAGLVWGKDYILKKFIFGMRPKNFMVNVIKKTDKEFKTVFTAFVRKAIK